MKPVHAIAIHNCNAVRTCIIQQCPPGLLGARRKKETNGRDQLCCKLDSTRLRRFNSAQQLSHTLPESKRIFFFKFILKNPKIYLNRINIELAFFFKGKTCTVFGPLSEYVHRQAGCPAVWRCATDVSLWQQQWCCIISAWCHVAT